MRRLRYSVAMSLDGYIAGPKGEADWITMDPNVDMTGLFNQFDTILVGRGTFEPMATAGRTTLPGMKTIVFSTASGRSWGRFNCRRESSAGLGVCFRQTCVDRRLCHSLISTGAHDRMAASKTCNDPAHRVRALQRH
jgi:hypothetical protein